MSDDWEEGTDEYDDDEDSDDGEIVAWICPCGEINPIAKPRCMTCGEKEENRIA